MQNEITAEFADANQMTFQDVIKHYNPEITDEQADYILWNDTCYPFDTVLTLKQLFQFFNKEQTVHP